MTRTHFYHDIKNDFLSFAMWLLVITKFQFKCN